MSSTPLVPGSAPPRCSARAAAALATGSGPARHVDLGSFLSSWEPARFTFLILLLVLLGACGGGGRSDGSGASARTVETYERDLLQAGGMAEAIRIFRTYANEAGDQDLLRRVASDWKEIDQEGCASHFRALQTKHARSALHTALAGLTASEPTTRLDLARRAIELDPNDALGYRLLVSTYAQDLCDQGYGPALQPLRDRLAKDDPLLVRAADSAVDSSKLLPLLFRIRLYQGEREAAGRLYEQAIAAGVKWDADGAKASLAAAEGKMDEVRAVVEAMADARIAAKRLPPEDKPAWVEGRLPSVLRQAYQFDRAAALQAAAAVPSEPKERAYHHYGLACLHALAGHADPAFAALEEAVSAGFDQATLMHDDTDFTGVKDDPRWTPLLERVRAAWSNGADARRAEALASRLDRPAPDWSLVDAAGDTIRLADFRGRIVVLDFWATWCGPCRMAMPKIDQFTEAHRDEVKVFSIDVWENEPDKAKIFVRSRDYDMHLVFGSNELTQAYGVTGIPTLFVIDREGRIRFQEIGYSDDLLEKLNLWVEELKPGV